MKFNLVPIILTLRKLDTIQEFKDLMRTMNKQEKNTLKDKLVYRLMFDKRRSDDVDDERGTGTEKWFVACKEQK